MWIELQGCYKSMTGCYKEAQVIETLVVTLTLSRLSRDIQYCTCMVLQWCYKSDCVTRMLQGCYKVVTRVLQGTYSTAPGAQVETVGL
jgi:hypothetical protein